MRSQVQRQLLKLEGKLRCNTEGSPAIEPFDVNQGAQLTIVTGGTFKKTYGYGHLAEIKTRLFFFPEKKKLLPMTLRTAFSVQIPFQEQRQA